MANLYPTFAVPTILEETQKNEAIYKGSSFFDFETGDFAVDGGGRMLPATGFDAWKQWCVKTIATQRRAFWNYTDGLGIEGEEAMALPTRELQQLQLETTITEALLADPYGRTREVRDFQWRQGRDEKEGVDSLRMTCTIVGQDDRTATISYDLPLERSESAWQR